MDRGPNVGQMVGERPVELLLAGEDDRRLRRDQLEERRELVGGQQLGERLPRLAVLLGGRERRLGKQAVIGVDLRGRIELDQCRVAERALGEGRKPADRFDLVAEQLDAGSAVLGRTEDVEDASADGELAAVGDLLDPFVAGAGEQLGNVAEVDLLADVQGESGGPQRRLRNGLGEGDGAGNDDRSRVFLAGARERVESGDPQAHEVRWRRQVRLVAGPAGGVKADPARRHVGAQIAGEIAGAAIVGGDDEHGPAAEGALILGQRREEQWSQTGGDLRRRPLVGGDRIRECAKGAVLGDQIDERAKRHVEKSGSRRAGTPTGRSPAGHLRS